VRGRKAWFSVCVLVNLLALSIYVWTLSDTLHVSLKVQGNTQSATINGYTVAIGDYQYRRGKVGLSLEDYRSYFAYSPPVNDRGRLGAFGARISNAIVASNPPSAWGSITISDLTTGQTLLEQKYQKLGFFGGYRPPSEDFSFLGDEDWRNYTVEATILRPKAPVKILVRGSSPQEGYLFWFRPENGDMGWDSVSNGDSTSLAVGSFRLGFISALKADLREFLWSYIWGLTIIIILLALTFALAPVLGKYGKKFKTLAERRVSNDLWTKALALIISLSAMAVAAIIAKSLLGCIPHVQDSVAYLFQAKVFSQGRLYAPSPSLPEFFEHEFVVVRNGMWFGKYPPGHPLILAIGVLSGTPWLMGPILGGLSLLLIFWAGREIYSAKVGLLAIFLGLFSPFFLFLAGSFMAHISCMFFVSLFLLCYVKTTKGAHWAWPLIGGFAIGFAFINRQLTALSIAVPFILYALFLLFSDFRRHLPRYSLMILGALLPVIFLLWYNWVLTGHPLTNTYELWWDFDRIGFGAEIGMGAPHTPAKGLTNAWHNLTTLSVHLFGWPSYLTLAFLLVPFATLRASRWDYLLLGGFLALVGGYVFYWTDGIMYGPRYYYEALPMLLLLSARGLAALVGLAGDLATSRIGQRLAPPWSYRTIGWGLVAFLVVALISHNLVHYLPGQWSAYKDYNYISADSVEAVKRAGLRNALVFVEHEPGWQWWKYGCVFSSNSPFLDSDVIYARDLGEKNYELIKLFPERGYYRLRGTELEPLISPTGIGLENPS